MKRREYTSNGMSRHTAEILTMNLAVTSFVLGINPRFLLPEIISGDKNGKERMQEKKMKDALSPYFPHISDDEDPMEGSISPLSPLSP